MDLEERIALARRTRNAWVGPEYRIQVIFRVPLDFAFRWCTDYSSDDAKLEGESYQRKIVSRTRRRVVLEDLEDSKDGWTWTREDVRLRPPNRWHMDGVGNQRDAMADYLLTALSGGRTQLEIRWRRRPKTPAASKLTKAQREAAMLRSWKLFAAAMERDYRASRRKRN